MKGENKMINVKTNCQTTYQNNHSDRNYTFRNIKQITITDEDYNLFMTLRKQGRTYGEMLEIIIRAGFDSMKKEKVGKEKSSMITCPNCKMAFTDSCVYMSTAGPACPRCGSLLRSQSTCDTPLKKEDEEEKTEREE